MFSRRIYRVPVDFHNFRSKGFKILMYFQDSHKLHTTTYGLNSQREGDQHPAYTKWGIGPFTFSHTLYNLKLTFSLKQPINKAQLSNLQNKTDRPFDSRQLTIYDACEWLGQLSFDVSHLDAVHIVHLYCIRIVLIVRLTNQ